ncbi:YrhB family protein [Streptomyces sp. NBC_01619]|uniref:YrhB domain-containing protein n=1 Tax=Streptomyces sp. NBC_01619 TaxID=2975901 RepID=UPI00224CF011|nr:YrhB domain-containing protein [Streptomyces sp. NBC_01619]MCX4512635.1 YrhB family protein [Streptomyces sp. NBC_01619]
MLSRDEALESAAALLGRVYPEKRDSLVMVPEKSVEYIYGWAIAFDWKEHIETGDWLLSPITSVVIVPHDGGKAHFPPSAFPVDDYMSRRATGNWPPKE